MNTLQRDLVFSATNSNCKHAEGILGKNTVIQGPIHHPPCTEIFYPVKPANNILKVLKSFKEMQSTWICFQLHSTFFECF